MAIERERKTRTGLDMTASTTGDALSRLSSYHQTQANSPLRPPVAPVMHFKSPITTNTNPNKPSSSSSIIHSPLSPNSAFRNNPNNLFRQIIQERLNDVDHKMAQEISSSTRHHHHITNSNQVQDHNIISHHVIHIFFFSLSL